MKSVFKLFGIIAFIAVIVFVFITCDNGTDSGGNNEYPYTTHGIWSMGSKPGLYSWSSDQEFDDALNEISQIYFSNSPSTTSNVAVFNNKSYDIVNWEYITRREPKYVMDSFWQDLYKKNYTIGSCWLFNYVEIPSKTGTGIIYAISAIVTNSENGGYIRYNTSIAELIPIESRSILNIKQTDESPYLLHGKTVFKKDLNKQILNGSSAFKVKHK